MAKILDDRLGTMDCGLRTWRCIWAWAIAKASASVASNDHEASRVPTHWATMRATWSLEAAPRPVKAFLTRAVGYSTNGMWCCCVTRQATPRAWPIIAAVLT